jgi:hypothetical protein
MVYNTRYMPTNYKWASSLNNEEYQVTTRNGMNIGNLVSIEEKTKGVFFIQPFLVTGPDRY